MCMSIFLSVIHVYLDLFVFCSHEKYEIGGII